MNVVTHNLSAMFSDRMLGITNRRKDKSMEKLSSGYKINRAADDAAGLSISEKMRKQIRGLTQASNNSEDGISFCQIADGALQEVHDMLDRAKELTVKAANGTMSASDRADIQNELKEIQDEIDRIHTTTKFNELDVFSDNGIIPSIIDDSMNTNVSRASVKLGNIDLDIIAPYIGPDGTKASVDSVKSNNITNSQGVSRTIPAAQQDFVDFVVQSAAAAASRLATAYPELFSVASTSNIQVGLDLSNYDGAGNTLALAWNKSSSTGTYMIRGYKMQIDTSDYDPTQFGSFSDEKKADLAATIAHEMTHLVMYDTLTAGMTNGNVESFPKWFKEGTAQTSSGDNNWVSGRINSSSSDSAIKNYMSQLNSMPYGAGYVAAMYLGYAASGSLTVNVDSIKSGLDKIFTDVAKGKLLSDAIKDNTSYSGLGDFENQFMKGEGKELDFVKKLLQARGTSGAGSLLSTGFSVSEKDAFSTSSLTGNYSSYAINSSYQWYYNYLDKGGPSLTPGSIFMGSDDDNTESFSIQAGADNQDSNRIKINRYNLTSARLFQYDKGEDAADDFADSSYTLDVSTIEGARTGIDQVNLANKRVSVIRSYYGAMQNRMEHTIRNLDNVVENTASSESKLRDTDMAREMVAFSKDTILAQAGQSMLAQANQSNSGILSLLQ